MRWVLPYIDQPPAFWERVREVVPGDEVTVYVPMPQASVGSGRPPQPASHRADFLAYGGVRVSVLLNPIVHEGPAEEVFEALRPSLENLVTEYGVAEAVVASVGLARVIREALPDLRLSASTLLEISTPAQAVYLEGIFDSLTPSGRIVRDTRALAALKDAFGGRIRLMVNEGCLPGCVYRTQHFAEMNSGMPMPASLCAGLLEREPWLALTGAWILPQHLDLFDGLYDELKLDGRVTLVDPGHYLRVLRAYAERTPLALDEIGGGPVTAVQVPAVARVFFAHTLTCDKACDCCEWCRSYHASGAEAGEHGEESHR
ncbi:MAG: hypothetical protein Q7W44_10475 [Coriobacteriia bacterium]|nr:hypothetical protein [Coriobacteriia bacterium]